MSAIHHVTAIAGNPVRNLDFYARTLGLRFVKKTVNFDDPGTYHFYYGDETGDPGTILTFFAWEHAAPGHGYDGPVSIEYEEPPPKNPQSIEAGVARSLTALQRILEPAEGEQAA